MNNNNNKNWAFYERDAEEKELQNRKWKWMTKDEKALTATVKWIAVAKRWWHKYGSLNPFVNYIKL